MKEALVESYESQNTNGSTNESTSVEDQLECQGCNEDFPEDEVSGTYYLYHNAGEYLRLASTYARTVSMNIMLILAIIMAGQVVFTARKRKLSFLRIEAMTRMGAISSCARMVNIAILTKLAMWKWRLRMGVGRISKFITHRALL